MTNPRPPFEEAPALKRFSMHVRHGFFGRRGGVSTGVYKSLNCGPGSGDEPEKVFENRRRVCHALGAEHDRLASPRQIHSAKAVIADTAYAPNDRPECDALVTKRPGLLLGVLAADCAPIVICDPPFGGSQRTVRFRGLDPTCFFSGLRDRPGPLFPHPGGAPPSNRPLTPGNRQEKTFCCGVS